VVQDPRPVADRLAHASGLTPPGLAFVGVSSSIILSTLSRPTLGGRPDRGRSRSAATPPSSYQETQLPTDGREQNSMSAATSCVISLSST